MWRVRLVVLRIVVHVRSEELLVRLVVKKGHSKQDFPKMYRLAGFECTLNAEWEFFLNSQDRQFALLVLLVNGSGATKLLGEVNIGFQGPQSGELIVESRLTRCPDANSSVSYQLSAEQVDTMLQLKKPLLNLSEVDSQYYLKQIKELRERLSQAEHAAKQSKEEAERAQREYASELEEQALKMREVAGSHKKELEELAERLAASEAESEQLRKDLMQAKKKLADVVDVLNEAGDASVLQRIQELMSL